MLPMLRYGDTFFDQELVDDVKAHARPVDDPLVWMLAEPRRLRRTLTDAIWMKFLDIPCHARATHLPSRRFVDDAGRGC